MAKKQWKSYDDYLKSDKFKEIKKDFMDNHCISGGRNICEVTGEICDDKSLLHHHHFRYPKNWENDSPENLVLISKSIHVAIHTNFFQHPKKEDTSSRLLYLSFLRRECARSWDINVTGTEILCEQYEDEIKEKDIIISALLAKIKSEV